MPEAPVTIVLRPGQRVGEYDYLPGDSIDTKKLIKDGIFNERLVASLLRAGFIAPITRETYARAIARRPKGTIGLGLDVDWLIANDIIDEAPLAPEGHKVKVPADAEPVGDYLIFPVPAGKFIFWDVVSPDGVRMRERRLSSKERAVEFVATLPPLEKPNDGDVRSEADGAD